MVKVKAKLAKKKSFSGTGKLKKDKTKFITELKPTEARKYFLRSESYFYTELPAYFDFTELLKKIDNQFKPKKSEIERIIKEMTKEIDVNHTLIASKDGKYSWRKIELINPLLYVLLVKEITKGENWLKIRNRFKDFSRLKKITCYSIPIYTKTVKGAKLAQINFWLKNIERKSMALSLKYSCMIDADIANCYPSIYTHSIAWALHGKGISKNNKKKDDLLGNTIDWMIRAGANGQTNGIPQGSNLMDFVAELVLGYADMQLSKKIARIMGTGENYEILRYRDDYRIFAHNRAIAEKILKILSEVLFDIGLQINASKTVISNSIIKNSMKPGKVYRIVQEPFPKDIFNHLIAIHDLSQKFPQSGALQTSLSKFFDKLPKVKLKRDYIGAMIGIIVDIAYNNPDTYRSCVLILNKLLLLLNEDRREATIKGIIDKFQAIPNNGHLFLWLQYISLSLNIPAYKEEKLCLVVSNALDGSRRNNNLWNVKYLENKDLKRVIQKADIVSKKVLEEVRSNPEKIKEKPKEMPPKS